LQDLPFSTEEAVVPSNGVAVVIEITSRVRLVQKTVEITKVVVRPVTEDSQSSNHDPGPYNHRSMTVTVRSFAKINVGLRIGAAREDGFHELLTVYQTIGLYDVIHVSIQRGRGIEIRCVDPRVPRDESNTCFRIAEKAVAVLGAKGRVLIEIEKRLPVQGGLGGASVNAVATLLGLERAARKTLSQGERLEIAAAVGSDLPLFLVGGTVLGVGRGEQVFPLPDFPPTACVVVTPEIGVSTPKAFQEWDRIQGLKPLSSEALNTGVEPGLGLTDEGVRRYTKLTVSSVSDRINELGYGLSAWLSEWYSGAPSKVRGGRAGNLLLALVRAGIENDFEQVVFPEHPELGEVKRALVRAGAKYASLSGSGSTLYGLFASRRAAELAVSRLRKAGWVAQATSTLTRAEYWRRLYRA
jgi:4-diphosphocytidyl-2-C-methyl-D-erythritol kinase